MIKRMLIALPAALLIACGTDSAPPDPASTTTTTTTTITTTAPTTTTTTTAAVTTTTAAKFEAADGRDLRACADGTCEVIVRTGDSLPDASGTGPKTIQVKGGVVTLSQTSSSGFASSIGGPAGSVQQTNNQVYRIVLIRGTEAVLQLSLA